MRSLCHETREPGGVPMIDVHCHDCGRVLVGTRQIVSVTSGEAGMEVAYVCWCGRLGAEVMGRRARREHASTSALGSAGGPSGVRG